MLHIMYNTYFWITILVASLFWYVRKWYNKRRKSHSLFKRLGIPYVKPHFIYGSFHTLKGNKKQNELETVGQWIKKYGKIFGYYIGTTAYISISDLEVVKRVLVKDFHNFANRPHLAIKADPVIDTLVGLRDQRWKEVRSLLAPTFSAAKMKFMVSAMNNKVDTMLEIIENSSTSQNPIDLYKLYQGLTIDVISECALAMNNNCQHDQENDKLLGAVRDFLQNAINPVVKLAIYFPPFAKFLCFLNNNFALSGRATTMITENLKKVIAYRRDRPKERKMDILQLMLDASEDIEELVNGKPTKRLVRKTLSDKEIIANSWIFLLGGFETTAAALTFTSYLLAMHPDIQEKLYKEVKNAIKNGENHVTYDDVFNLTYLDQVISESLRLYPSVATFMTREAKEDILINDLFIPKGTNVSVPVWHIHHNPDLWPDPYAFDPERFSPASKLQETRHPMSYMPFGEGPRNCIGKRFALMEAKIALVRTISSYKFEICDKTPREVRLVLPTATLNPADPILIQPVKRT